jgi:hypothetical protein
MRVSFDLAQTKRRIFPTFPDTVDWFIAAQLLSIACGLAGADLT